MKTFLLNCLLIVILLVSCSSPSDSKYGPPLSTSEQIKIIGKPIRIGNIEVAQYDFPKTMSWYDADESCKGLGDGWRLPTKDELNLLYKNKDKMGVVAFIGHWSSTEYDNVYAWGQNIVNGFQFTDAKDNYYYLRAVRTF